MYIDSRKIDPNQIIESEICIIGGGAAGITLALEWANKPFRVCVLESGGVNFDPETHRLNHAINIGREYPDLETSRLRYLGGATNHWGGHCVPIRPLNFERREWIPYSGWPISRIDLDPYYKKAHEILKLGEFCYNATTIASSLEMKLFPFDSSKVESVVGRYNPLRFGLEYGDILGNAPNVAAYLYANVTSINQHPDGDYIQNVTVKTLAGNTFTVRAKHFVLAAGGIENARLLLLSNQIQKNGLGNAHDLVGRFFMEHIWYPSGVILPANQDPLFEIYGRQHAYGAALEIRCHIALPEHIVRTSLIPDFRAELRIQRIMPESISSARVLRDKLTDFEFPDEFAQHLLNIMKDPGTIIHRLAGEKLDVQGYSLRNYVEQVPNPDSRISLSYERDKLGLNKVTVDWRLSEIDKVGIRKAHQLIAREVGRTNFGRMRIEIPEEEDMLLEGAKGGAHHMGTTRMHVHPHEGVVNADCRIHGLKNMFVAGSSVFPTCGYSNPTLTIVALAIRLVDHLNSMIAKEGLV